MTGTRPGPRVGRVLIVVPARDEVESLPAVLAALRDHTPHEILVVDDGSTDGTRSVALAAGARCLSLPCSLGYGGAVQAGLELALDEAFDAVVLFDADGQHPADAVERVLDPVLAGRADVAIGSRYADGRPYAGRLGRRLGQRVCSALTGLLTRSRIFDTTSGFKAMTAAACRTVVEATFLDLHVETIVRLSLLDYRIVEVPVTMAERRTGTSMHGLASAWKYPTRILLLSFIAVIDTFIIRSRARAAERPTADRGELA